MKGIIYPYYTNPRFKSETSEFRLPLSCTSVFSGLKGKGRSEVDLLFYPQGSEPLAITTPPPRENNEHTSQASEERPGAPNLVRWVGNCACASAARAPPFAFKPGGGNGNSAPSKSVPLLRGGTVLLEPCHPHTHSPAPRRSSELPGSQQPSRARPRVSRHLAGWDGLRFRQERRGAPDWPT